MTVTPAEAWAKELGNAIEGSSGERPGKHVMARAALLLQDQKLQFVDATLDGEGRTLNGRVVVFTDRCVLVMDLDAVPSMLRSGDQTVGRVQVQMYPRSALQRIEILQDDTGANRSDAWLGEGQIGAWPWSGQLSLTYAGASEPFVVPGGDRKQAFDAFLPALVSDLDN